MAYKSAQGYDAFGFAKNSESTGVFARADFTLTTPAFLCE